MNELTLKLASIVLMQSTNWQEHIAPHAFNCFFEQPTLKTPFFILWAWEHDISVKRVN